MLNQICITGNLGDDPEIFYASQSGEPVANFSIAFSCGKDKDGSKKTGWIRCVCFKRVAEICERHLHKGARIAIVGSLSENSWTNDEGKNFKNHQIIVNTIEFIKTDGRGFADGQNHNDGTPF